MIILDFSRAMYSSVELLDAAFAHEPSSEEPFTVVTVGWLPQLYETPDVLIKATAVCVQAGLNVRLVLVGDGKHRAELETWPPCAHGSAQFG